MERLVPLAAIWIGIALLALAGLILAARNPRISTFSAAGGFVIMCVAQVLMHLVPRDVELVPRSGHLATAVVHADSFTMLAQVADMIGLLVGACGLLTYALGTRYNDDVAD